MRFVFLISFFAALFPLSAHAVGQGVYMRINTYFANASIRETSRQCVDLKGGSLQLNTRVYLESESGVFSGCISKPSRIQFAIYQGTNLIQSYTLNVSTGGSSLVLNQDFTSFAGLQGVGNLYPHFGNGSQDFVSIAMAPRADHWQADAETEIIDRPINQVLMPGTHDTGTYGINGASFITPDAPSEYIDLVKNYATGWSRTQEMDVSHQLSLGIRYFDVRLCGGKYSGEQTDIFTCHGFSGARFFDVIDQLAAFLDQPEHAKEIVIIDMNHLYSVTDVQLNQMNDYLKNKFQNKIASSNDFTPESPYSAFWNAGKQVILSIDSNSPALDRDLYWAQSKISSPWPNADNASDVINAMNKNLNQRSTSQFFVLQSQKTPNSKNMVNGKLPGTYPKSIKEFTGKDKNDILNWLQSNKSALRQKGNIIIEDFSNGLDLLHLRD